ncbi:hypothetical protein SSRV2_ORF2 [Saccharolobus shibatae rod virus 2]|nr:hypothetical protein SSRV2_ORF2 [Saccharolobus shibatae rod virus 2]
MGSSLVPHLGILSHLTLLYHPPLLQRFVFYLFDLLCILFQLFFYLRSLLYHRYYLSDMRYISFSFMWKTI